MRAASLRPHRSRPLTPPVSLASLSLVSLTTILAGCSDHHGLTAPASRVAPLLAGAPLNVPAEGDLSPSPAVTCTPVLPKKVTDVFSPTAFSGPRV